MKPCNTCKHMGFNLIVEMFMGPGSQDCKSPRAAIDPVTGSPKKVACFIQRRYEGMGCGPEGRWHSDNEVKP